MESCVVRYVSLSRTVTLKQNVSTNRYHTAARSSRECTGAKANKGIMTFWLIKIAKAVVHES